MSQSSFDQLAKQYLEEFLEPLGVVERQYEVPGEPKFVDVWFVPDPLSAPQAQELGVLAQITLSPCLLEPFSSAPTRHDFRTCLLKLLWIQEDERRKLTDRTLTEDEMPYLWIFAATTSQPVLQAFGAQPDAQGLSGFHHLPQGLKTTVVAIDQLPETPDTLWLRILGRGSTLDRAVQEVLALPPDHPRRDSILHLLISWRVTINAGELQDFITNQETFMAVSETFAAWEQSTQQRGVELGAQQATLALVLRLLARRVGPLSPSLQAQVEALPLDRLEALSEALLDFSNHADLEVWLSR